MTVNGNRNALRVMVAVTLLVGTSLLLCMQLTSVEVSGQMQEHEAGVKDWHKSFVGTIAFVVETESGFVVASEDGVVAGIDSHSGSIVWRKVLREGVDEIDNMFSLDQNIVVICGNGKRVLSFVPESGVLVFDSVIHSMKAVDLPSSQVPDNSVTEKNSLEFVDACGFHVKHSSVMVVVSHDTVSFLSARSGSTRWVPDLPEGASLKALKCSEETNEVFVVVSLENETVVITLDLEGKTADSTTISEHVGDGVCGTINNIVVCTNNNNNQVKWFDINDVENVFSLDVSNGIHSFKDEFLSDVLIGVTADNEKIVFGDEDNQLVVDKVFPSSEHVEHSADSLSIRYTHTKLNSNNAVKVVFGDVVIEEDVADLNLAHTSVSSAMCSKKHGLCLVCFGDGTTVAMSFTGHRLWVRDDTLSSTITSSFFDLPLLSNEDAIFDENNVVKRFLLRTREFVADVLSLVVPSSVSSDTYAQDDFNTHKLIVTASNTGKLIAMKSVDGEVVWRLSPLVNEVVVSARIHTITSSQHKNPIAVFTATTLSGKHFLVQFNQITGTLISKQQTNSPIIHSMIVPHVHVNTHSNVLLVATEDKTVHVFPESANGVSELLSLSKQRSLHFHTVSTSSGVLKGFRYVLSTSGNTYEQLWRVEIDPTKEKITSVVSAKKEKVASLGVIRGDKGVLYKYLNPNLIAIATLTPYVKKSAVMTIYLLDTVKGAFIHRAEHTGVRGPVHMAMSENWLVYTYRNRKAKHYELSVMELYDSSNKEKEKSIPFSSLKTSKPIIHQQSYIFPTAVSAIGVTTTEQGITEKRVLFALGTDSVFAINNKFFDPRRPTTEKGKELAPNLPEYAPILPAPQSSMFTYNKTVSRVHTISTTPSGLESTSLVLVQGLDFFYSSVAPSGQFDLLDQHFNKLYLLASLAFIVSLTVVLAKLKERKSIKEAWK
eukprot:m.82838 g.82838  ORF g.82838 m.82838 type:complete len:940 (+) comp12103_c0_seq4:17-2836(+)